MLRPDERAHLFELLRPPDGYQLDCAVGTTFSLDLESLVTLPLSFALFDWEDERGRPVADPLALLEAVRRFADRLTVFCQTGQIKLPRRFDRLVTWLESAVYEVLPKDRRGVFHPKLWILRFTGDGNDGRYRVLCLSRNLTFDRSWDTVVALDGELTARSKTIRQNHPLAELVEALPRLARPKLPAERHSVIRRMARELRRVRFELPEGFDDYAFWHGGIDEEPCKPFDRRMDKVLIVSPFLSASTLRGFQRQADEVHLVSRLETLQELKPTILRRCKTCHTLEDAANPEESDDEEVGQGAGDSLHGLHAKVYIVDRGWWASVFAGSFNATTHAFEHNVEFMVELVGRKSRFGVGRLLDRKDDETGFADLLRPFAPAEQAAESNPDVKRLEELLRLTQRMMAEAKPRLRGAAGAKGRYKLTLRLKGRPRWPRGVIRVRCWPITQNPATGADLTWRHDAVFGDLSLEGITSFLAVEVTAKAGQLKQTDVFVMNVPLLGGPADRKEQILASLVGDGKKLMRLILFMLAAGKGAAASPGEIRRIVAEDRADTAAGSAPPHLLEALLRTLHQDPEQLKLVASMVSDLRKARGGKELLNSEFLQVWEPIWETYRQEKRA